MNKTRPFGYLIALPLLATSLTACGNSGTKDVTASTAPAQPVKTVTVSTTPSPSSPTGASTEKASQGNTDWVMPNEVGEVLQDAQDAIQGVTDNPFFYTASHDALGKARFQVLDRDWQVCSQSPSAGTSFNQDTDITFDVVKLWEDCP